MKQQIKHFLLACIILNAMPLHAEGEWSFGGILAILLTSCGAGYTAYTYGHKLSNLWSPSSETKNSDPNNNTQNDSDPKINNQNQSESNEKLLPHIVNKNTLLTDLLINSPHTSPNTRLILEQ